MTEFAPEQIEVELLYALAERYWSLRVSLPAGADVSRALREAGSDWLPPEHRAGIDSPAGIAVFGRPATLRTRLRDGDRIELLRPLQADPKQARKQRAADAKRARR
jgi:hypothetical protein